MTAHRVLDGGAALKPVADVPAGGHWPRDLHVDGEWMHVANERSDTITTFRIGADGVPGAAGAAERAGCVRDPRLSGAWCACRGSRARPGQ